MSEEVVEQITRDPPKETLRAAEQEVGSSKNKAKDPKKVAAGKKLAEYNKKAKEALARETLRAAEQMKREKEQEEIKNEEENGKAWLPELSFTTVLSIIGIGFTAFDMFMRYYKKDPKENRIPDLSQVPQLPQPSNIIPQQPLDRPKIGMI